MGAKADLNIDIIRLQFREAESIEIEQMESTRQIASCTHVVNI